MSFLQFFLQRISQQTSEYVLSLRIEVNCISNGGGGISFLKNDRDACVICWVGGYSIEAERGFPGLASWGTRGVVRQRAPVGESRRSDDALANERSMLPASSAGHKAWTQGNLELPGASVRSVQGLASSKSNKESQGTKEQYSKLLQ